MDKTEKVIELAKEKAENSRKHVLAVIDDMKKNNEKITFYSVQKKSGVSKAYIYKNNEIRSIIEDLRDIEETNLNKSKDEKDIIIAKLELELKKFKLDELWKVKYDNKCEEVRILSERLQKLYGEKY